MSIVYTFVAAVVGALLAMAIGYKAGRDSVSEKRETGEGK